ncbi:hypothetical Protein YC6258_03948 [Gynuella sunshinyii YC6258]|uniref:Uncharacterized protein n=1 Tax=Gynuella sunshinyii YC6258 TaxID=1445510 RepID=A0A0C5VRE0_9GAMM|nr:hypothetical Protein YC6258_03948 [Gynuella sunshinyii YC6258]
MFRHSVFPIVSKRSGIWSGTQFQYSVMPCSPESAGRHIQTINYRFF